MSTSKELADQFGKLAVELHGVSEKIQVGTSARIAKLYSLSLRTPTEPDLIAALEFMDDLCKKTFRRKFDKVQRISEDDALAATMMIEQPVALTMWTLSGYVDSI